MLTLASFVLVVLLEREINVRGAILGDLHSWMGVLFNFSVVMIIGGIVWAPIGLILSIALSQRLPSSTHRKSLPAHIRVSLYSLYIIRCH